MKVVIGFFLALCLCAVCFAAPSEPLAIEHVTVIDATGRPAQPDQTVLIVDGRILAVGPAARLKPPKGARILDARGKFLIPGLWDMHVHIAGVSADPVWSKKVLLPLLLAYGITGVRDMGGDLDALLAWRHEIDSGALPGPHIIAAGPFLTAGGKKTPEQYPVANAEEARAAVRELKQRGADFIKIISLPSQEAFFAVADEAKKQGLPFAGHLPFQIGAAEASAAGQRSIEHLLYSAFELSFSSKEEELHGRMVEAEDKGDSTAWEGIVREARATRSAEKTAALWATLKKDCTWVTPTLASLDITSHPERWRADDPLLAYVPPTLAEKWRASIHNERMKQRAAWVARQAENDWVITRDMHRAGVPLLIGSDALDPFVFPGDSLHRELAEFVRAGFSPMEALQATTQGAAKFLGREAEFGTVEAGRRADLLLLDANPLEDIGNTRAIHAVIRDGKLLDRAALDALLADARAAAAKAK